VQDRLGADKAGAFDLLAACSGFIFALNIATQAIRSGSIKNALVIGSETLSRIVDWNDRGTCILFGDGAGAFVLQAREERAGVVSAIMRSDGSGGDLLYVPAGGSRTPASIETVTNGKHYIHMNGREVFRFATRAMSQSAEEAIKEAGITKADIQLVIPHQANLRIIEAAMRNLEIPMERCMVNLDRFGNTSTASIPIATCEAVQQGRLKAGDKVVFVGFGGGLTWGSAVAIWSGSAPGGFVALPVGLRVYARFRSLLRRILRRLDALIWGRHNPYI
jgi:3-oxoacyl-[acyl-carrier-protein] synthase-3